MNYNIRVQLEELQKKYYVAIDEAYQARTVLGEQYFEEMRKDLFDRYIIEREQLKKFAKIPDKNIDFATDLKIRELTPRNKGFLWLFKNEEKQLKIREINVEVRIELDARTANVEDVEEKIYPGHNEKQKKTSLFKRLFARNQRSPVDVPGDVPEAAEQQQPAAPESSSPANEATEQEPQASAAAPDPKAADQEQPQNHKRGRKPKQPAEPTEAPSEAQTDNSKTNLSSTSQLPGQLSIDTIKSD